MPSRVVSINITGNAVGAIRAFAETSAAGERTATRTSAAFTRSTNQIAQSTSKIARSTSVVGTGFTKLGTIGASFGIPFATSLSTVGQHLDKTSIQAKSFGSSLSAIGGVEAAAAGIAILAVGTSAVRAASDFDTSHARLISSIKNANSSWNEEASVVGTVDARLEKLGFTHSETENAMSRLTTSLKSTSRAAQQMGIAVDIARARGLSLSDATDLLVKTNAGFYATLHRTLGVSNDIIHSFHSSADAVNYLAKSFSGQGSAYAQTFAGKLSVLGATAKDLEVSLGNALIPRIEQLASGAVNTVAGIQSANRATDGWLGRITLGAAAIPVFAFAMDKLGNAGARLGGALDSGIAATARYAGISKEAARSAEEQALAESEATVAISRKNAAASAVPTLRQSAQVATGALAGLQFDQSVALERQAAANDRLVEAKARATQAGEAQNAEGFKSTEVLAAEFAATEELTLAKQELAAADAEVLAVSRAVNAARSQQLVSSRALSTAEKEGGLQGAASVGLFAKLGAVAPWVAAGVLALRESVIWTKDSLVLTGSAADQLTTDLRKLGQGTGSAATENAFLRDLGDSFQDAARGATTSAERTKAAWSDLGLTVRGVAHRMDTENFGSKAIDKVVHLFGGNTAFDDLKAPVDNVTKSLTDLYKTDPTEAIAAFTSIKAHLEATGTSAAVVDKVFKSLEKTLGTSAPIDASTRSQTRLNAATEKYRNDILDKAPFAVQAKDARALHSASADVAAAQDRVNAAMAGGADIMGTAAERAKALSNAYYGITKDVRTTAEALNAANEAAFGRITANINLDTAKTAVDKAAYDVAHQGSGGTSATQTALDKAGDELSLRDALRQVVQTAIDIKAAERGVTDARRNAKVATDSLHTAEQNYRDVMNGVSRDSKTAQDATNAFAHAQISAKGAVLDLADAQRSLGHAQNDVQLSQFNVRDARSKLDSDRSNYADNETIIRDQIALRDAQLDAATGTEAVRRAQLGLRDARLTSKEQTDASREAEDKLFYTLHGYPKNSEEAKAATKQLSDARIAARDATLGVATAERALQTAQDQTATSALALRRAQAQLNGSLKNSGDFYSTAQGKADKYRDSVDALKLAQIQAAEAAGTADAKAGRSFAHNILTEIEALQSYVSGNALLQKVFGAALDSLDKEFKDQIKLIQEARKPPLSLLGPSGPKGPPGWKRWRDGLPGPTPSQTSSESGEYATGGAIGSGDPNGIPVVVHPHEYVIQSKAVAKYGVHMMDEINAGQWGIPEYASGGQINGKDFTVAAPSTTAKGPLSSGASTSPEDMQKHGAQLITGLYVGMQTTWKSTILPFFTKMRPTIDRQFVDSHIWLTQAGTYIIGGLWHAVQDGYVPVQRFFQNQLPTQLQLGAAGGAAATHKGWASIEGAFSSPANWSISHVLNPLVEDVNKIAHAVGMKDIASTLTALPKGVGAFESGGKVPGTGLALVHEGEGVLPKAAMANLTPSQFEALRTGSTLTDIYKSIASEAKGKRPTAGATGLVNALSNEAAADVFKYIQQIVPPAAIAPSGGGGGGGGGPITPISIQTNPGGFAGALANARLQHELTGIPTSVMLTQSANETGGWTSQWYRDYNNPAGIGVTGAAGAGGRFATLAEGWANYAQKLLGHGEAGQEKFVADLLAGASALQLLIDIEQSPWAAGHYGGHGLEALYPQFAAYATGGPTGAGNSKGFPALLHPHEFVVQRKAVEKYGLHAMESINAGTASLPRFDKGGYVAGNENYWRHHGMLIPGNIDLNHRFVVANPDGSASTIRSASFGDRATIDGRSRDIEVLIPTAINKGIASLSAAMNQYRRTGKHLGIFDNARHADAYGEAAHNVGASHYAREINAWHKKWSSLKGTLREGLAGQAVTLLQEQLNFVANAHLPVDGKFGPRTRQAVANVERFFGAAVDGVVGPKVHGLLDLVSSAKMAGNNAAHPPEKIPGFANGGYVPGAIGVPQLAVVHGGEHISPAGRGGAPIQITIDLRGAIISSDVEFEKMVVSSLRNATRKMGSVTGVSVTR